MRWKNLLTHPATILLAFAAAIYLPFIGQIGYSNDDWYLMYAAGVKGAGVFRDIFAVDRPLRALVMIPAYLLFGANPIYYHLSAFAFRVLGAFAFYDLTKNLWPRQRTTSTLMALLFLIYPGFLSQTNAIDYQSHLAGLAAALISLTLTIRACLAEGRATTWLLHALSVLLGWFYLGQMEWYIGFEAIRWGSVFLLTARRGGSLLQKGWTAVRWAFPSLLAPIGFLFWRMFLFESERGATDLGAQFGQLTLSPLATGLWWLVRLVQDFLNVLLLAYGVPLTRLAFDLRLSHALIGFAFALTLSALAWMFARASDNSAQDEGTDWRVEAFWLGGASIVAGILPVILVNRHIIFPQYSRYTLAASAGSAMMLTAFAYWLNKKTVRLAFLSLLVGLSALTHFANNVRAAQETQAAREFWWQVSWRAPQFDEGTTLVAHYAIGGTEEDYFIWGPANLIYYPEGTNPDFVQPGIHAAILNDETIVKVIARERQEFDNRRSIRTYKNYRNILIVTQPTLNSCVQIIDGFRPDLSRYENAEVRAIAAYSETEHIRTDEAFQIPPALYFGEEPAHGWCYYYQKAALARQRGEWGEIVRIGEQAQRQGLEAGDLIEWMPFLEAYAHEGQVTRLEALSPIIRSDAYVASQVCQRLRGLEGLSESVMQVIETVFCAE
jgi:hypothetical protein